MEVASIGMNLGMSEWLLLPQWMMLADLVGKFDDIVELISTS
jgi:hypothetical protein